MLAFTLQISSITVHVSTEHKQRGSTIFSTAHSSPYSAHPAYIAQAIVDFVSLAATTIWYFVLKWKNMLDCVWAIHSLNFAISTALAGHTMTDTCIVPHGHLFLNLSLTSRITMSSQFSACLPLTSFSALITRQSFPKDRWSKCSSTYYSKPSDI